MRASARARYSNMTPEQRQAIRDGQNERYALQRQDNSSTMQTKTRCA
uniref:Uncharacterized protein n=1 Tax=Arundo donax TaxID=35708 RepID=A0A0A8Z5L2_ARUDO